VGICVEQPTSGPFRYGGPFRCGALDMDRVPSKGTVMSVYMRGSGGDYDVFLLSGVFVNPVSLHAYSVRSTEYSISCDTGTRYICANRDAYI
jgi:hypothetical protein